MKTAQSQPLEQTAPSRVPRLAHAFPLLVVLPGVTLLALQQARFWSFFIDDSFISLVYVRNFFEGRNLSYNGLFVEGYSNFLWVIGVILVGLTGLDLMLAAKILGVFSAHASILAVVHLGYLLSGRWRDGMFATLLLAATGPFVAWSVGGLEGPLLALLLLLCLRYLLIEEQTPHARWSWSAVAALLAALTRPEAIGFVGIIWAWLVVQTVLRRRTWATLLVWSVTVALGFGLFLGWRYLMYGDLIPAPVYAKRSALSDQIAAGVFRLGPLRQEWSIVLTMLALGTAGYLAGAWAKRWHIALMSALVVIYTTFVIIAGGDWMPMYRYLVPILPVAALLIAGGSVALVERFGARLPAVPRGLLAAALVAAPLLQIGIWTEKQRPSAIEAATNTWNNSQSSPKQLGQYLASINDGSISIALIDAGAIAYYSGIPAIDLLGLNNRYIAHLPGVFGYRVDPAYVFAAEPTFIEMPHRITPRHNLIFANFGGASKLYYTREFQRWYERVDDLPLAPFRRRAVPLATSMFDNFYAARVTPQIAPEPLVAGEVATVPIEVLNMGTGVWIAQKDILPGVVFVLARIINPADGSLVTEIWAPLQQDMLPGERQLLEVRMRAPKEPDAYVLEIDMVLNEIGFFSAQGSPAVRTQLDVQ
jgi:hypothetical protein